MSRNQSRHAAGGRGNKSDGRVATDMKIEQFEDIERFPSDFMFELTKQELEDWRCQFGTSNGAKMGLRYPPMAFTEQGVAMFTPLNAEHI